MTRDEKYDIGYYGADTMTDEDVGRILQITESILEDYRNGRDIDNMDVFNLPDRDEVIAIVVKLLQVLFPGYYRDKGYKFYNM